MSDPAETRASLRNRLLGASGTGSIVPPSGISAWLIVFVAAAMTFLAVAALAFALSATRLADNWSSQIEHTATVRVSAPVEVLEDQTRAVMRVLRTTPGIESARIVPREEQADLLTPWIGADMPVEAFNLPRLIAVDETDTGPDREGLRLRLAAEAEGAVYDDHKGWRDPIIAAANRVGRIGGLALFLVLATLTALVILAAQAAVIANAEVINTLRLIGAEDRLITRAFVRRLTLRAALGAAIGALAGMGLLALQPAVSDPSFMTGLGLQAHQWLYPLILPLVVAGIAYTAARVTVAVMLQKVT